MTNNKYLKDKELIIFDLDGTLINSIPDLTLATNKMLKHYELPQLTIEETSPFIGNGAKALVERAFKHNNKSMPEKLIEEALNIYFEAYREAPCKDTYLYDGVAETLSYLNEKNYKMVICTNKPYQFIEPILDSLNVKQYFESWVGADSLPKQKPDPTPLLHFVNKMNIPEKRTLMVGDSKNDILAAHNAKIQSVGVTYGYNYNESISDYNPTVVIEEFSELKKLL